MDRGNIPAEWLPHYTYSDYEQWEGDWELIYGIPYAMSPSAKRIHQSTGRKFILLLQKALNQYDKSCNCEVYYELDWIIDESTVVRPDVMLVCGVFEDDFLRFPPSVIIEITSKRTPMADRNVKFKLYEKNGVPYYLIADTERKKTEVFQLVNQQYEAIHTVTFSLGENCKMEADVNEPWVTGK